MQQSHSPAERVSSSRASIWLPGERGERGSGGCSELAGRGAPDSACTATRRSWRVCCAVLALVQTGRTQPGRPTRAASLSALSLLAPTSARSSSRPDRYRPPPMAATMAGLDAFLAQASHELTFWLNGTKVVLDGRDFDPDTSLLAFLRSQPGLTGTKQGCNEGGCGACTVVIQSIHPRTRETQHLAINACLAPLVCVEGKHVITVEGIGNSDHPHPLQERMAKLHGSQCGFCTPGIVMSVYALLRNAAYKGRLSVDDVELQGALDGNLCRCTGYAPIFKAVKSFVGEYLAPKSRFFPSLGVAFSCAPNSPAEITQVAARPRSLRRRPPLPRLRLRRRLTPTSPSRSTSRRPGSLRRSRKRRPSAAQAPRSALRQSAPTCHCPLLLLSKSRVRRPSTRSPV